MAGSVNKVILIGNLGKDPEVRTFQNGGRVCNLSVATSESWKDKATGERKEKTEWHRVCIFNDALVGIAEKYLRKGSKVYLEGQVETRKYTDKDNVEKYTTEIVLRPFRGDLTLLDRKEGGAANDYDAPQSQAASGGGGSFAPASSGGAGAMDDEIPF